MDSAHTSLTQAMQTAVQHHQAGRLAEAEKIYRRILERYPDYPDALHLLGLIAQSVGKHDDAASLIRRAIAAAPDRSAYHFDLGNVLMASNRLEEAASAFARAAQLQPNSMPAHFNLGNACKDLGRFNEAAVAYARAVELEPGFAEAHNNLGNVLKELGQVDAAIAALVRATQLKPAAPEPLSSLAGILKDQGRLDEALACCERAVSFRPDDPAYRSSLIYLLHFHPRLEAADILNAQREWDRRHGLPLKNNPQKDANDPWPNRRLKIGYVSPNFCDHVVGHNVLPLFREHDRRAFEIIGYCDVMRGDALTDRFRSLSDGWRDISAMSHEQVAQQVRDDRIDILVDLTLHMARNRLPVFAAKPAPVQVTFAGYPAGTGLRAMDYRLTDPHLDPPGMHEDHYVERSIPLADTFWCYDPEARRKPGEVEPEVGPLPALHNGTVTFGCLNNFCKINEKVLLLWSGVLEAVKDSRLLLLAAPGGHRAGVVERLGREGIDPARIEFLVPRPRSDYLAYYHRIDIGLDTLPYNGHSTSLDSCWMGVPVITLAGRTAVGRAGLSQLTNLGLTELIADTPAEFLQIAVALAGDLPRLAALRADLRPRMRQSPLMDAARFARSVEAAYRQMWEWRRHAPEELRSG